LFKIIKKDKKTEKRAGIFKTIHGGVATPVFMPIATQAAVKNLTSEEIKDLGGEIILGNTYHLSLRPGEKIIKKAGGLHKFMNWSGPILTDSGGYQVFSLGSRRRERNFSFAELAPPAAGPKQSSCEKFIPASLANNLVKISDKGVHFRDPLGGKKYFLTPEKSIQIQLDLGSDIIMVLDECAGFPCSHEEAEKAVRRTTEWAKRCFKYFYSKIKNKKNRPLLFCIIQGSVYQDLRIESVKQLLNIGFSARGGPASLWDGYAIGGVAVGEPREYLADVLRWVLPLLPENKPRYLMGLGRPEEIVSAVGAGIDMFDCVIPTREARHGRIYKYRFFTHDLAGKKFYETLQITNSRFAKDFRPIDENCQCYTCRNLSRAYLNHLFKIKEPLALRLATIHNLKFYLDLMKGLKVFF